MTEYTVAAGATSNGITLNNGDFMNVSAGGTASATTVNHGAYVWLSQGGSAAFTTLNSGGILYVDDDDTRATFTTVNSGGSENIDDSSAIVSFTTVNSGGVEELGEGTADGTILDGGFQEVGGRANSTTVNSGGFQQVNGVADGTTVNGGGFERVSGGETIGTVLSGGGYEVLSRGSISLDTVVNDGSYEVVSNRGTATETSVNSGGFEFVSSGGKTSSGTVSSGGFEFVSSGGISISNTVDAGGYLVPLPHGSATEVSGAGNVVSTGVLFLQPDAGITVYPGLVSGLAVSGGAVDYVLPGGTAISTTVGEHGQQSVFSGGTAGFAAVSSGGVEATFAGGTADGTTIGAGGTGLVHGGTASGMTVFGTAGVELGGTTISALLIGGFEGVSAGGTASGTVVSSGGILQVVANNFNGISGGIAVGTTISNGGAEFVYTGATVFSTTVGNGGSEYVFSGGTADFTTVGSGGTQTISAALDAVGLASGTVVLGTQIVSGGVASGTIVSSGGETIMSANGVDHFAIVSSGGSAVVAAGGHASGTMISNGGVEIVYPGGTAGGTTVDLGGAIDLTGLAYSAGGSATVNSTGMVVVTEGSNTYQQQLSGTYTNLTFQPTQDSGGGTVVTLEVTPPPCFAAGTRVATASGEVTVEALTIGDHVLLHGGRTAPIVWIGRRRVDCARHSDPKQVWPVRVAAGAFGPGEPHRDLFLSPDHAVFAAEALIPVRHLINGGSIAQVEVSEVTYFHVELAEHDVLIAEGLPVESYLDTGDRRNFENGGGAVRLHPDFPVRAWEAMGCVRLLVTGPVLDAVRQRVNARAPEIEGTGLPRRQVPLREAKHAACAEVLPDLWRR